MLLLSLCSVSISSPVLVNLQSKLPDNPIEVDPWKIFPNIFTILRQDPRDWAWGLHPDRGLDYKAKDGLSLEVSFNHNHNHNDNDNHNHNQICLDNPELINTAKCSLPLELCLSNKKFTPLVGCSGQISFCLGLLEVQSKTS